MRLGKRVRLGGLGPSLGAAASLVAAGVVLVLVVAGLLGAPVWPGASDAQGEELTLATPPVSDVAVPEPVGGTDFAPERSAVAAEPTRASGERPRRPSRRTAPRRRTPRPATPAPATPTSPAAPSAPTTSEAPRESTGGGGGRAGGGEDGGGGGGSAPTPKPEPTAAPAQPGPVQQTVSAVREVAAPVTEALPAPVATVVNEVLDTVEQTAATVDQTLDPVTGLLQRKP